jgi:hypothetical protein
VLIYASFHEDALGCRVIVPRILNFGIRVRKMVVSRSGHFTPEEGTLTHCVGGWTDSRADLYVVRKRKALVPLEM